MHHAEAFPKMSPLQMEYGDVLGTDGYNAFQNLVVFIASDPGMPANANKQRFKEWLNIRHVKCHCNKSNKVFKYIY